MQDGLHYVPVSFALQSKMSANWNHQQQALSVRCQTSDCALMCFSLCAKRAEINHCTITFTPCGTYVCMWAFNCLIIFWCLSACIMFLSLPPKVQGKLRIINLTSIACKRSCADTFSNFTSVLCYAFVTRKTTQTHTILELAMSFQGWTVKKCATCPIPGQYPDILHAKIARGNKSCPCFSP